MWNKKEKENDYKKECLTNIRLDMVFHTRKCELNEASEKLNATLFHGMVHLTVMDADVAKDLEKMSTLIRFFF